MTKRIKKPSKPASTELKKWAIEMVLRHVPQPQTSDAIVDYADRLQSYVSTEH